MTREQAKEILQGMSFEECIEMWNEYGADHYNRSAEIHDMEDFKWWDYLSSSLGAYYLMWFLLGSDGVFKRTDDFFLYNESSCEFYSFNNKEELLFLIEDCFIEEIINQN